MTRVIAVLSAGVALVTIGLALAWLPLAPIFLGSALIVAALYYDFGAAEDE